jgi:protein-disulfide isomerase
MHDLLFDKQDSIGLKSFRDFGRDGGVAELTSFDSCLKTARPDNRIAADTSAARYIGGFGTPTILINGLRLASTPDSAALDRLVEAALDHRPDVE